MYVCEGVDRCVCVSMGVGVNHLTSCVSLLVVFHVKFNTTFQLIMHCMHST